MPAQAPDRLFSDQPNLEEAKGPLSFSFPATLNDCHAGSGPDSDQYVDSELFQSILFIGSGPDTPVDDRSAPESFPDLLLDQVVASITVDREEYNLKPFFYSPAESVEAVDYRQEVFRDLENPTVHDSVESFAQAMRKMRDCLRQIDKLHYRRQKQSWFLDAVEAYCGAVRQLHSDLTHIDLSSAGFRSFRGFLASYLELDEFKTLAADTEKLRFDMQQITYSIHIDGRRITVMKYIPAPDYGADVLETFTKFSQGATKRYKFQFRGYPEMNHVEAAILDLVAQIYPETFSFLHDYSVQHKDYLNRTIARFDREVQFYLAWMEYMQRFRRAGLSFCYPVVSNQSKTVVARDVFDMALAEKLISQGAVPVTNNFYLTGHERILLISGPNQGGKTTFARTFGQLHYLASLGCPVAGNGAKLFLFDRIFTHFEREEDIQNLSGNLENELARIYRIFQSATPNSILIMNESFLSTTLNDALFLSRQIMERIVDLDMLCVSVTFLDELTAFSETIVSMVSTLHPKDPALRTFKLVRKPGDGLAHAAAIAENHRLTFDAIKSRISQNAKGRAVS